MNNLLKLITKSQKPNQGFTMVEMLVSIGIVTLIMSSILFNYSTFSDNLALSSAGQEMAIIIRQAQTYGLAVKETSLAGGNFDSAYGVYFDISDDSNYYLFTDLDADEKYDSPEELVEKFTLRNGVRVSDFCDESACPPSPSVRMMDITFLRPNTDARINFTNNGGGIVVGPSNTGKVVLVSRKGSTLTITVESTGQVLVGQIE